MKTGFWEAPEGAEGEMTIAPLNLDGEIPSRSSSIAFLAKGGSEDWIERCPATASLLPKLVEALNRQKAEEPGQLFDIFDFSTEDHVLLGEVLGQGEVSGVAVLPSGITAHIQESVMTGLWRVRFTDASGAPVADYLEVASIPQAVRQAADLTVPELAFGAPPPGAMNVMPVLAEISSHMAAFVPGSASHIITFTLFPMNDTDMRFLQDTLGDGPVQLVSRGYGTCRIHATGARNVWSVQFFNAMDTIILDTLEIGDVPVVGCAADEDFRDSAERLHDIEEAYFK